ncbi:hypothetical protein [Bradyrhizobium sp.]|uniref:hypothetical protein n=1 Tax=Bradyrhizobium sp. TaxID=376 RepID=UPI0039E457CD
MQTTIDKIKAAHTAAMLAIHEADREFGDHAEGAVLMVRLQEAGKCLHEAENLAVRVKSRRDLKNELAA